MSKLYGTLIPKEVLIGTLDLGVEYFKGDTGDSGVYVGEQAPENPEINVWIEPDGTANENGLVTKEELDEALKNIEPEVDLTGYAKTEDIPDVSGFQTADQVETAINNALNSIGVAEEGVY